MGLSGPDLRPLPRRVPPDNMRDSWPVPNIR